MTCDFLWFMSVVIQKLDKNSAVSLYFPTIVHIAELQSLPARAVEIPAFVSSR